MPKIPDNWKSFEKEIANWMRGFESDLVKFKNGYQAIPGFPSDGFRGDGVLTDGKILIAVEVELKQSHPDTNVGKYWLLNHYYEYEKIVLFHVYTPAFGSYPWRLELGSFYAKKMTEEMSFEYKLIDERDSSDPAKSLRKVQGAVGRYIRDELGVGA
jgi:hypothetical protein